MKSARLNASRAIPRTVPLPPFAGAGGAVVIVAATLWVFWPALHGGWLWDDALEVANNPLAHAPGGWWKSWVAPYGMDYLPLKSTLQWVQWHLWGGRVIGYHLVNVALHCLAALLLWRVLGRMGVRFAWLGGLVFAVHPVAVESVAWISEFKNTLSFPLMLAALSAYMDWEASPEVRPRRRRYAASLCWFAAAMLCKTSVVVFPFVLGLYVWWRRGRIVLGDLRVLAPFFAISLALGLVALRFQWERAMGPSGSPGGSGHGGGESGWRVFADSGWRIIAYASACVAPRKLAPVYGPSNPLLPGAVPWLVIGGVLALFWANRNGWGRHALFASGWFLIFLFPVIGWVPIAYLRVAPRADHLAYLSLAGVAGGTAAVFSLLWNRFGPPRPTDSGNRVDAREGIAALGPRDAGGNARPPRRWGRLALVVACFNVCLGLAEESRAYSPVFFDESTFWREAASREPNAWLARNNWGRVLLSQGHADAAQVEFEAARRLEPGSAEVLGNLGSALDRLGRRDEALADFREAVKLEPGLAGAHYDLGRALLLAGHADEAEAELRAALNLEPGHAAAHDTLGLALARRGRIPEAIAEYRAALDRAPDMPEAHLNLGNACLRQGRTDEAVSEYRAALRSEPGYAAAHRNLAVALQTLGRTAEAQSELKAAAAAETR